MWEIKLVGIGIRFMLLVVCFGRRVLLVVVGLVVWLLIRLEMIVFKGSCEILIFFIFDKLVLLFVIIIGVSVLLNVMFMFLIIIFRMFWVMLFVRIM